MLPSPSLGPPLLSASPSPALGPWGMPFELEVDEEDDELPDELCVDGLADPVDELDELELPPPQAARPTAISTAAKAISARNDLFVFTLMVRSSFVVWEAPWYIGRRRERGGHSQS